MGIFHRIWRLIKASINSILGKAENHDPGLLLNQAVDDMQDQMQKCKKEVAEAIAAEKWLAKAVYEQRDLVKQWADRAVKAVQANNDELAKEALSRKKEHMVQESALNKSWQTQKDSCEKLKVQLRGFNNKIEEAKRKKGVLVARQEAAEATKQIAEASSSFSNSNGAFATFERMEDQIDKMEAGAEATAELSEEYSGDTLENKFANMENASGADDDLAALKAEMGITPPTAKKRVAVHDEEEATIEFDEPEVLKRTV